MWQLPDTDSGLGRWCMDAVLNYPYTGVLFVHTLMYVLGGVNAFKHGSAVDVEFTPNSQ